MMARLAQRGRSARGPDRLTFLAERLHPAETAEWLTGMAERGLHRAVRTASPEQLVRLVDGLADIVWNTLYAPARRSQSDWLAA
jgi:hypothetical protein